MDELQPMDREDRLDRAWRSRAETMIGDSRPHGRPFGRLRVEIQAIQAEAVDELASLDQLLGHLGRRRLALTRRIRDCHATLIGTDHFSRKTRGPVKLPAGVRPSVDGPTVVGGAALRIAVHDVLRTVGISLRTVEILELLLASRMTAAGDKPLQSVWNALRTLQRRGLAEQVGRGRYRASGAAPSDAAGAA